MNESAEIVKYYEENSFEEELARGTAGVLEFFSGDYEAAYMGTMVRYGQAITDTYLATIFLFIRAMLSYNPLDIQECLKGFEQSIKMAKMIKQSISEGWFKWYSNGNDAAHRIREKNPKLLRHAELVMAEALMIRAALLVGTDERGGWQLLITETLHMRQSYQFYSQNHTDSTDAEFMAGVQLGLGFFASLFAFLPPRIARIFEILGYYEAEPGMTHFMIAVNGPRCGRAVICELIVLMLRLSIRPTLMGNELTKMEHDTFRDARRVLEGCMKSYPDSTITDYFLGRLHYLEGNLEESKRMHLKIINTMDKWLPIRNVALWEALQLACAEFDWRSAANHSTSLAGSSRWSPAFFTYAQGVFEWASDRSDYEAAKEVLQTVPGAMKRIAGQSVPFEKFAGKRVETLQKHQLPILVYEFLILFDLFPMLSVDSLEQLEEEMEDLMHGEELNADDFASVCLLRGSSLKYLKRFEDAISVFREAITIKRNVSEYWYAIPMIYAEAAPIIALQHRKKAKHYENLASDYPDTVLLRRLIIKKQDMCRRILSEHK